MRACDLLALLQQREKARLGYTGRDYDDIGRADFLRIMRKQADSTVRDYMKRSLAKIDSRHASYASRLPTSYQSVQDYARLADAKERMDVTLRGGGNIPPRGNLVLGSVETTTLNARSAYYRQSDEYLIVFNRALLTALLRICNYVACILTPQEARVRGGAVPDGIWREEIDPKAFSRVAPYYRELLVAVNEGRFPDPRYTFGFFKGYESQDVQQREARWYFMEDFVTDFTFAHEYIHVLLDHLSPQKSEPTEDNGGWGHEYEADSVALELVVHTWMNELKGNPVGMIWLLQAISLFFVFVSHTERYAAEILGNTDGVWRDNNSHPPTWIRYRRLTSEISRYPYLPWRDIRPHIEIIEQCLEQCYIAAVGHEIVTSAASLEWRFQWTSFESLGLGLFPQQLFVATRCVKWTLDSGLIPGEPQLMECAADANRELERYDVRLPADISQPLVAVVEYLCRQALDYTRSVDVATVHGFADELAKVALRDARTRYPKVSRR